MRVKLENIVLVHLWKINLTSLTPWKGSKPRFEDHWTVVSSNRTWKVIDMKYATCFVYNEGKEVLKWKKQ